MKKYRHGDVIIEETQKIEGEKLNHLILAEGEISGHYHRVAVKEKEDAELYEKDGNLFLKVIVPAKVTHEEHGTIDIPTGNYIVRKQREYTPDGWMEVQD